MQKELRALTSLRGLAALYVALLHCSTAFQNHAVGPIPALAPRGHLAVDFFFVLSGFILAYSYSHAFDEHGYFRAMPSFLVNRAARILPLHFFITIALLTYTLVVSPDFSSGKPPAFNSTSPLNDVVLNLFLLQGIGLAPNMNAPSWSISVEMFIYFLFPLFLLLFLNKLLIVRCICAFAAIASLVLIATQRGQLSLDTSALQIGWTMLRGFAEFGLGVLAYGIFASGRMKAFVASDRLLLTLLLVPASMMLLRLWDLIAVLTFPLIIICIARNKGLFSRMLEHRLPHFLGVVSFSLYLVHYPLAYVELQIVQYIHPALLSKPAALLLAALAAFSAIPIAWTTYVMIERPGRDLIRGIGKSYSKPIGE